MAPHDDLHTLRLLIAALEPRAPDDDSWDDGLTEALADLATRAARVLNRVAPNAGTDRPTLPRPRRAGERGPEALIALRSPAPALEAVLRVRGLTVLRVAPEDLARRAHVVAPALIVQDPFADPPDSLRRLYEWRRDPLLAHTELLLVRQREGHEESALGDVSFLCRPLGRADLSGRLRVLVEGIGGASRALLVGLAGDEAGARLSGILRGMGITTEAVARGADLAAHHPGADVLIVAPALHEGVPATTWLAELPRQGERPDVVLLLGPDDPEQPALGTTHEVALPQGMRPLARALDRVLARVARHQQSVLGIGREVLSYRAFSMAVERGLDYARRHGRRLLVVRVAFHEGDAPLPAGDYRELEIELTTRFRAHDLVALTRGSGLLLLLPETGHEHLPCFEEYVLRPAREAVEARLHSSLPPLAVRAFAEPDDFHDFSDLLAQIG